MELTTLRASAIPDTLEESVKLIMMTAALLLVFTVSGPSRKRSNNVLKPQLPLPSQEAAIGNLPKVTALQTNKRD